MKFMNPIIVIVFALSVFSTPAFADACSNAARSMISGNPNATLLSVRSKQGGNGKVTCEARIKISADGKPPRIVVKKFNP